MNAQQAFEVARTVVGVGVAVYAIYLLYVRVRPSVRLASWSANTPPPDDLAIITQFAARMRDSGRGDVVTLVEPVIKAILNPPPVKP